MRPEPTKVRARTGRAGAHEKAARKIQNRRIALESLEPRTLLATLPTAEVTAVPGNLSAQTGQSLGDENYPDIAVSPTNPNKMVAVWSRNASTLSGLAGPFSGVGGAFTINGGTTWTGFTPAQRQFDPNTTDPTVPYTGMVTTGGGVAFDRNDNVYVLTTQNDALGDFGATSQAVVLSKFNFSGNQPVPTLTNIVEQVIGDDIPLPLPNGLIVDTTLPTFTDPDVDPLSGGVQTIANPFSGNVYIALQTTDTPPELPADNPFFNPYRIRILGSSDGGQTFSGQTILNDGGNFTNERNGTFGGLTVSQGTTDGRVAPGQVTAIWSDENSLINANPPQSRIMSNRIQDGLVAESFGVDFPLSGGPGINDAGTTQFIIPVNSTDVRFDSISDIDVTISMVHPNTDQLSITLVPPTASNLPSIPLVTTATLTGANLGIINGFALGTTFDDEATRNIFDPNAGGTNANTNPFIGHDQPRQGSLDAYDGLDPATGIGGFEGNWTIVVTDNTVNQDAIQFLDDVVITFTSGLTAGADVQVATSTVITDPTQLVGGLASVAVPDFGIHSEPVIAADNTLGKFSAFQGRLYAAWVDRVNVPGNPADNTDIHLAASDDGGFTWTTLHGDFNPVNDDRGALDGFSEGLYNQPAQIADGRPQFQPAISVDQETGTLVVAFRDTRHDASRARAAIFLGASIDGGSSFNEQNFLQPDATIVNPLTGQALGPGDGIFDAATGQLVERGVFGPLPDNLSAVMPDDAPLADDLSAAAFVVQGGRIVAVWNGNLNFAGLDGSGNTGTELTDIYVGSARIGAGPRVVESSQGPLTPTNVFRLDNGNLQYVNAGVDLDGTPVFDGLVVTFDRPIYFDANSADGVDPNSFGVDDVRVYYNDTTSNNANGGGVPVEEIIPLVDPTSILSIDEQRRFGPSRFYIRTARRTGVGGYSYQIGPNYSDRIRHFDLALGGVAPGNFADQNADGDQRTPLVNGADPDEIDVYAVPTPIGTSIRLFSFPTDTDDPNDLRIGTILAPFGRDSLPITLYAPFVTGIAVPGEPLPVTIFPQSTTIDPNAPDLLGVGGPNFPGGEDSDTGASDTDNSTSDRTPTFRVTGATGEVIQLRRQRDGEVASTLVATVVGTSIINDSPTPALGDGTYQYFTVRGGVVSAPLIVTIVTGNDTLAVDRAVQSLDVTFDRDMQVGSFTSEDVLRLDGPAGRIQGPFDVRAVYRQATAATITDNGMASVSTIVVPDDGGAFRIQDLDVNLDIRHPRVSDLRIELVAPDNTVVRLANRRPLNSQIGRDYRGTVFDQNLEADGSTSRVGGLDKKVESITNAATPFTGRFVPEADPDTLLDLRALFGKPLAGTWHLRVTDLAPGGGLPGDTQGILAWSLSAKPTTTGPDVVARSFRIDFYEAKDDPTTTDVIDVKAFPAIQQLSGTYSATLSSDIRSARGELLDQDRDAGLDLLREVDPSGVITPILFPATLPVGGVPLADATVNGPGVTTSTLTITDDFLIQDLDIGLTINHPRVRDLSVTLITPVGDRVRLFNPAVLRSNGANFTNTVFDDAAATFIFDGGPPYNGSFAPEQPLSGAYLDPEGNSRRSAGTYTLEITDSVGGATGTLVSWSLSLGKSVGQVLAVADLPGGSVSLAGAAPILVPLVVTDNFLIQDLNVGLTIAHPRARELTAVLITPNLDRITLFSPNSLLVDGPNFTRTILDDGSLANPSTPIRLGGPPYFGPFAPEQALTGAYVDSAGNPRSSAGSYFLEITDSNPTANVGALTDFYLEFSRQQPGSGVGEEVADRVQANFRIHTMDPTNPVSSSNWTPVGPAAIDAPAPVDPDDESQSNRWAGRVSALAVDSSDPSGNTVFVSGASGGVWRTTNFLTNDPKGPTYVPLTDFGPNVSLNVGSIAVFARNGDPDQSIVFVATGEADDSAGFGTSQTSRGVGFLRSMDGGRTWEVLDSRNNTGAANTTSRDRVFVGSSAFKVLVDPKLSADNEVLVYAALTGPNGGIWRSDDTGDRWQKVSDDTIHGTTPTDLVLDPFSADATTGNLDRFHAAFRDDGAVTGGVYRATSRGENFTRLVGGGGKPLVQDPANPPDNIDVVPVGEAPRTGGRIVLSQVTPTGVPSRDLFYQDWLYAASVEADDSVVALYLTKDRGDNWTRAEVNVTANGAPVAELSFPDLDLGDGDGNFAISLAVDPNDPLIVYLGGNFGGVLNTAVGVGSLIRIDTTRIHDGHNLTAYEYDGFVNQLNPATNDADASALITDITFNGGLPTIFDIFGNFLPYRQVINLSRNPATPLAANSTFFVRNVTSFNNDGNGLRWTPFDDILVGANGVHELLTIVDPITGKARLLAATDQGVYTGVDDRGQIEPGTDDAPSPTGSRNGNLQIAQIHYGAAQPSSLAAQISDSLFQAGAWDVGYPASQADVLTSGDLNWPDRDELSYPGIQGSGTGVATAQVADGSQGAVYQFKWLGDGGRFSDFFQVNGVGRTVGLIRTPNVTQDPQWWFGSATTAIGPDTNPDTTPGLPPIIAPGIRLGNFAVNPINNNQVLISSGEGRLYGTEDQGRTWREVGVPAVFGGASTQSYAPAIAFGAPEPGIVAPGSLNDFVYVGTVRGQLYVTRTGGGAAGTEWSEITGAINPDPLDRSPILSIVTSPDRGSTEAYVVTRRGIYYNPQVINPVTGLTQPNWTNITTNLFSLVQRPFDDQAPNDDPIDQPNTETDLAPQDLHTITADWRYLIPGADGRTHPILYAAGNSGVFRSLDNGTSWTTFPDNSTVDSTIADGSPADAGYLPNVRVTDLDLSLGFINPANGRPVQSGSPNTLLASTFGRGQFAIRLAPVVVGEVGLDADRPAGQRGGSDSGLELADDPAGLTLLDGVTKVATPFIEGLSEQTAFGNVVRVTLYEMELTNPNDLDSPRRIKRVIGGFDPDRPDETNLSANHTNDLGQFSVQADLGVPYDYTGQPVVVPDNNVSGASATAIVQNLPADFKYDNVNVHASITHPNPSQLTLTLVGPNGVEVELSSGNGALGANYTDTIFGDQAANSIIGAAAPFTGTFRPEQPLSVFKDLDSPAGNWTLRVVDNATGAIGQIDEFSVSFITDGLKYVGVQTLNNAGTPSQLVEFAFTLDTTVPDEPGVPDLTDASDSAFPPTFTNTDGYTSDNTPTFAVADIQEGNVVFLFRNGVKVRTIFNAAPAAGLVSITDDGGTTPATPVADGTYTYTVQQVDQAGNVAPVSDPVEVTIDTVVPAVPTSPNLLPLDDTGTLGDGLTSNQRPRLNGTITLATNETSPGNLPLIQLVNAAGTVLGTTRANPDGTYTVQFDQVLADGAYVVQVRAVDRAGNLGALSAASTIVVDTTGPIGGATLALSPQDDTGVLGDNITSNRRPRLIGTTGSNLTVQLLDYTGLPTGAPLADGRPIGSPVFSQSSGDFTVQFPTLLVDGGYAVRVRVTDAAGNAIFSNPLPSSPYSLTIDSSPDSGTTDLRLDPASDTGIKGDGRTSNRRPFLIGTTTPNAAVEIVGPTGSVLASGTAAADGTFSLQLAANLVNGTIALRSRSRDVAGNLGSFSSPFDLTIETTIGDHDSDAQIDGKADLVLFRPDTAANQGTFLVLRSAGGGVSQILGRPGDIPLSADFDGDGVNDYAVFRPNSDTMPGASEWIILGSRSGLRTEFFGGSGLDLPAPADYDGDGTADLAVFRPNSDLLPGAAEWFIRGSRDGARRVQFGKAGDDVPVPADYDGDGRADIATFRPSSDLVPGAAQWFVSMSSGNPGISPLFGQANLDLPVVADYDGDGRADIAAYRPSTSQWFVLRSSSNGQAFDFGAPGDVPAPADYDGDGKADLTVYRASTSLWTYRASANAAAITVAFGGPDDIPVLSPLAYRDQRPGTIVSPRDIDVTPASRAVTLSTAPASASTSGTGSAGLDLGSTASRLSSASSASATTGGSTTTTRRNRPAQTAAAKQAAAREAQQQAAAPAQRRGILAWFQRRRADNA